MANLLYWLLAILLLGVVVTLHELGHFLAARATGIRVAEFAVGFGSKLLSRTTKSGMIVSLRVLPLGGYCRFVDGDVPEALAKQKVWKRAVMAVSGPLMNILTAILLLVVLFAGVGLLSATTTIGEVMPGLPAEAAGVMAGDRIVAVNGIEVLSANETSQAILNAAQSEIILGVERGGVRLDLPLTPTWVEAEGRSMIGIAYATEPFRVPLGESFRYSLETTGEWATLLVRVFGEMFTGRGFENIAGPIGTISTIKTETESGGLRAYLQLAAFISVNLGVFNLLPVPVLDGGKLVFCAVEAIRRKPASQKLEIGLNLAGFGLMMALMVVAFYKDIVRLLP